MTNTKEEINSAQYIEEKIREKNVKEMVLNQQDKLINSIKIGFKTLLYSKKWLISVALVMIFLPVVILQEGGSIAFDHPDEAFVDVVFEMLFPTVFIFGCLLMCLPLSADEISDHSIELYLIKPIKREVYWFSRWIVVNITVYCVNIILYFAYFLFTHAFATNGLFAGIGENLHVFGRVAIFLLLVTIIYSGTFLLVGMIGNRGLLLCFIVAIFELFFVSMFFLSDSPFIPQNNLYEIANSILPDHVNFATPEELNLVSAQIYVTIFPIVVFFLGAFYLRVREFK
ncbi:hypothetical protein LCGC14_0937710 [marine sediment metagenome]|uniref:ABC-2 type transporter domain-containing protein n=1 Tax=marine sediment metagenome TaxID=412755 RepID=A0A0F9RSD4_9ZZZZ